MRYLVWHLFRRNILFMGYILAIIAIWSCSTAQAGRISKDIVHSKALEGNHLGDSPDRSVLVYLPPSYDNSSVSRYPVLYLLHGNGGHNTNWIEGDYQGMNVKSSMDSLIKEGRIREMILVMPDVNNRFQGSHYVNSSTTGNWADFIALDLVQYIDATYRTLPHANGRGLAGHSMGGRGALYLAMSYPGVYSAIYGLSSGQMNFGEVLELSDNHEWWSRLLELQEVGEADQSMVRMIGLSAAFSPNTIRPPFYADFPFEIVGGKLEARLDVWHKWSDYDPVVLVPSHKTNLLQLRGIRFDSGDADEIVSNSQAFAQALTDAGIPYVYEEYKGNHSNSIRERIESRVLPFFSEILEPKE